MPSDNRARSNNQSNAAANSLVASGEDLPLLQPEMPPEGASVDDAVSLENPMDMLGVLEADPGNASQPNAPLGGFEQQDFNAQQFSESDAVFSEIRNFGEGGESATPSLEQSPAPAAAAAPRAKPRLVTTAPVAEGADVPISPSDTLPGWKIERYLGLVSAWASLEAADADPIAQASAQLSANAQARGANAVVLVKFQPTGIEGRGLLLVGTAVVVSGE